MTMDMFNSGVSNALPAEDYSALHASAPFFVQCTQLVPYVPYVPDTAAARQAGQVFD